VNKMPAVSVVIPSYNHASFIAEAVNSVLNQSVRDLELIVIDDGSTDTSLSVLAGFSDPRLKVISQTNQGAHAAINRGLGEASGKYLAILNSDDAYYPRRLERAIAALEADPQAGLVGSFIEIVDAEDKTLGIKHSYQDCSPWLLEIPEQSFRAGDDLRAALLTENYWATTSNYVFPRSWFERVGEFLPLRYAHDWDFALRMAKVARLVMLPEVLMRYRVHEKNTIRENQAAMVFEICWCLAVHLPQAMDDGGILSAYPQDEQVNRLLHSIYTYGLEQALSVMLLQRLHENPGKALELLQPGSALRSRYMDFIIHKTFGDEKSTVEQPGAPAVLNQPPKRTMIHRALSRLKTFLR
jgi:glycosyltransferase involved in cell wall biosynthesis